MTFEQLRDVVHRMHDLSDAMDAADLDVRAEWQTFLDALTEAAVQKGLAKPS